MKICSIQFVLGYVYSQNLLSSISVAPAATDTCHWVTFWRETRDENRDPTTYTFIQTWLTTSRQNYSDLKKCFWDQIRVLYYILFAGAATLLLRTWECAVSTHVQLSAFLKKLMTQSSLLYDFYITELNNGTSCQLLTTTVENWWSGKNCNVIQLFSAIWFELFQQLGLK